MARMLAVCGAALIGLGLMSLSVNSQDFTAEARRMMERTDVRRAFDHVDAHKDQILSEWIKLTQINAPSGKERERAEAVRKELATYKLDKVSYDSKGNLIAVRKGTGGAKAVVVGTL